MKLTYFNIEAAAEKVRLALVLTSTPFEDVRIQFPEWGGMKPTTKYGVLPIMEVDGKEMHQSMAQLRYVASLGDGSLLPKVCAPPSCLHLAQGLRSRKLVGGPWFLCLC